MDNALVTNVCKHITLSATEIELFRSFWTEKTLDKGDYLLQNGDVCHYDSYVISGALKAFYINSENGDEEILYFAIDDWWATDLESYRTQKPSIYSIQALAPSKLLQIHHRSFQQMLQQIPALERYFRIIAEGYIGTLQKRIIQNKTYDAKHRYSDFLENYPQIANVIPQYLIASYLGISAEFLSRIKKKIKSS